MITVCDLKHAIFSHIEVLLQAYPLSERDTINVPLAQSLQHVLARPIYATLDIPRQDISAMDGFAFIMPSFGASPQTLTIIGESCAGQPFNQAITEGQGVRIFTGAVVPSACNTVIMQEQTNFSDLYNTLDKSKPYDITLQKAVIPGAHIRRQGEEVKQGELVLAVGKRINPGDISLCASLGLATLSVFKPLTVGVLATGDELIDIGLRLQNDAQIYNSNTPTLGALLQDLPVNVVDYGIIPDNLNQTRHTVAKAIQTCDVLISSAGVSVGDYDFLTDVIAELGTIHHYKVAMKPGKPFLFGEFNVTSKDISKPNVLYFGLPGNPLSTLVCCLQFVKPALWRLAGVSAADLPIQLTLEAVTTTPIKKSPGRQEFQRAYFSQNDQGTYSVQPLSSQDSHRVKQLTRANCFIVLPLEQGNIAAGEWVKIEPFSWVLG